MSSRQPYSDATALLGMILDGKPARRDAVHIACEPVVNQTERNWSPGDRMIFGPTGKLRPCREGESPIGIIDPFLDVDPDPWENVVRPGQSCFLILMPGKVTSLRHVWSHPDFKDEVNEPTADQPSEAKPVVQSDVDHEAERWLIEYADECGVDFHEMIHAAKGHIENPNGYNYVVGGQEAEGMYSGPEFWEYIGRYLGVVLPEDSQANIISCSC